MAKRELDPCGESFDIEQVVIKHGAHGGEFRGECCIIEWSNRAAVCLPSLRERYGDPGYFGDDHPSISRVIRGFCISFNDGLPDDETRTRLLRPYITKVLGTATGPRTKRPVPGSPRIGSCASPRRSGSTSAA
jgi:hypothetical protein